MGVLYPPFFKERPRKPTLADDVIDATSGRQNGTRREDENTEEFDDDDNADLLLFSFFPSLPLVVVDVPLFVERRVCE